MNLRCIYCGSSLLGHKDQWPRTCSATAGCGRINYNSPKPVIALVLRSWGRKMRDHIGTLVIKRGIDPHKGDWAFPGGYIDHAEDWQVAAAREAHEELGVVLRPKDMKLIDVRSTSTNYLVMFVGMDNHRVLTADDGWAKHDLKSCVNDTGDQEILAIDVWGAEKQPEGLGIPSHDAFFQQMKFRP
jgi:ADP-ribose pyrophosphatase YjhB (NUDIX family)